jgi:uncharacterized protein
MGPTNVALVRLFKADTRLREAQARLDAVTKNVRMQQKRVDELAGRQTTGSADLLKMQGKAGELDLEIKSRDARIEHLREQQNVAQTNREYQAFLVEINTIKVDKAKIEEEQLQLMEKIEALQKDLAAAKSQHEEHSTKLSAMQGEIDARVKEAKEDVDSARPARDEAASAVPLQARQLYERLAEKFEGEAMAPIEKPHPRREEYICSSCNLDLTVDVYNRLHTRNEPLMCPSGMHLLYIPEDLTVDVAVHKPGAKKSPAKAPKVAKSPKHRDRTKDLAAPVQRQTLASSIVNSVDEDEAEEKSDEQTPPQS